MSPVYRPELERFWEKVDKNAPGGCWRWLGKQNNQTGYGMFSKTGRAQVLAHRYSYGLLVGPIPKGLTIDHLCRNRWCVNPEHLEPVTNRENILRGVGFSALNARKTHCRFGHEFTPENTYHLPNYPAGRYCRECRRIRSARGAARRRAER